ncbi:MAG: hypothetical protein R2752_22775 [Vicinamibacterales bacterium]
MSRSVRPAAILSLVVAGATLVLAWTTVIRVSGAGSGVKVTVTNVRTGESREAVTNDRGEASVDTGDADDTAGPISKVEAGGRPPRYAAVGTGGDTAVDLQGSTAGDDPRGIRSFRKALEDYARAHGLSGPPNWWIERIEARTDPHALDPLEEYLKRLHRAVTGETTDGPVTPLDPDWRHPIPGPDPYDRPPRTRADLTDRDREILDDEVRRIEARTDLTPDQKQQLIDEAHRAFRIDPPPRPPAGPVQGPPRDPAGDPRGLPGVRASERSAIERELDAIEKSDLTPEQKREATRRVLERSRTGAPAEPEHPFPPEPYDERGLPRPRDERGQPMNPPPPDAPLGLGPMLPDGSLFAFENAGARLVDPPAAALDLAGAIEVRNVGFLSDARTAPGLQLMGGVPIGGTSGGNGAAPGAPPAVRRPAAPDLALRLLAPPHDGFPPVHGRPTAVQVLFTSLGESSGPAFTMTVVHDGAGPLSLAASGFVLEPLRNVTAAQAARAMTRITGVRVTETIEAYCLEMPKAPPAAGTIYRLAPRPVQDRFASFARLMAASRLVRARGELHPDTEPEEYFHAIRQWAVWSVTQGLDDEAAFTSGVLAHARRNLEASGRRWTGDLEDVLRSLLPNRWRDVSRVVALAR